MTLPLILLLLSAAAQADPVLSVDEKAAMWTRAEYNAALLTQLAGLPTTQREKNLLKFIENPKGGQARPIAPIGDRAEQERLKVALGRDLAFLKEALDHRRNLDMSSIDLDIQMVQRFNEKHNGLIKEFWPKSGPGNNTAPPPITSLPPLPQPDGNPASTPGAIPGFDPVSEPAGNPGGAGPGSAPGQVGPSDAAGPNGDPVGKSADLGKLRGNFAKALGAAKDGAGSFDRKDDNLNAAPKPAGPQGRPGPEGQTPRPQQRAPQNFAPGNASGPAARTLAAGLPASPPSRGASAPSAFPARNAPAASPGAGLPSNAPPPQPAGNIGAVPGTASPGVGRPPMTALDPKLLEKKAPPEDPPLTAAEQAAIKEIQEMLAAASGDAPLDTEALKNGAGKLDRAAEGSVWNGVDVRALRDQVGKVIEMAGIDGLSLTQKQVVYQAAANLGLSDQQAGRIIRALRISEPPSPKLAGMTWWQRLLAWVRHYKKVFMRRLV